MTTNGANGKAGGALAGVRVIDLTRVLGGPYCTQMLGDHGADVIKIEPPQGDEVRDWGPPFRDDTASYFVGINRNKRTLALDLGAAEGRDVLLRLLEGADVLIHNYKPGTLEKWGIGYDGFLAARFPRLVYCHITGFGADGPLGGLPGYDAAVQAVSGLMSVNGTKESGPIRMGTPIVDLGTGLNAAIGILLALHERNRSGKGQAVDVSLYDSAIALLHPQAANYLMSGKPPQRTGNAHPNISPYDCYATGTKPVFLAVGNDRQFRRLCVELGAPQMPDDARFRTNADRVTNRDALGDALERLLANHDGAKLADRLLKIGVPCGAVLDIPDVLAAPHTTHRAMVVEEGPYRGTGTPIKMGRSKGGLRFGPRRFNQDGRDILREAGYGPEEIAALERSGAVVGERRKGGGE
ncbi:MAG: CoA transferase [Rhodospirillales bacterium]|nr:CoA transferase [Rhodospirillales bacterium]